MLKFHAVRFIGIMDTIRTLEDVFGSVKQEDSIPPHIAEELAAMTESAHTLVSELGLAMSIVAADRLADELSGGCDVRRLVELFRDLRRRIQDELDSRMVFIVSQDHARYYDAAKPLAGSAIVDELPDTITDAVEAGNCFAVGRYTACVFHLMRVMEVCVKALGGQLGVSSADEKTWQVVINDIRREVKSKYRDEQGADRKTYEAILSHLESVKIAWRNPTMHPKNVYTEEDAETILEAVRIFTDALAEVLSAA